MHRIIVSVQMGDEGLPVDLEVPAELQCEQLAVLMANTLHEYAGTVSTGGNYGIAVLPSRQLLPGQATLANVGVWDGAALVLQWLAPACFENSAGAQYTVPAREFWIGRRPAGRDVVDDDRPLLDLSREPQGATVSRRHAQVKRQVKQWQLCPARNARNPVTVNGRALAPGETMVLQDGDEIGIGGVHLIFRAGSEIA